MIRLPLAVLLLALSTGLACKERPVEVPPPAPTGEVWLNEKQVQDARIAVDTVRVRPVGSPVVAPARVTFNDLKVAHVFSPVAGRVIQVLAHPGDRVKKGTPLATVHSPEVGQAVADLARSHADLILADQEERRQKELFEGRAGSRRDLEAAVAAAARARAEFAGRTRRPSCSAPRVWPATSSSRSAAPSRATSSPGTSTPAWSSRDSTGAGRPSSCSR
jgi:cobalt-zinc-cadmium efflux system membrane fusion protein